MQEYDLKEWPNKLGYNFFDWEIMKPFGKFPYRARHIPEGECLPDKYGEGNTWKEAIGNAEDIPREDFYEWEYSGWRENEARV